MGSPSTLPVVGPFRGQAVNLYIACGGPPSPLARVSRARFGDARGQSRGQSGVRRAGAQGRLLLVVFVAGGGQ
eukprot:11203066-Lingulodinium_polyedra.AAC.1